MTEVLPHSSLTVVAVGLEFPESPRWYDSALYFSDMFGRRVCRVTDDGGVQHIVDVPNRPSGLGWLPDGRLLIVSMVDNRILAHDGVEVIGWSDLSSLVAGSSNDMVVDQHGRAYVGATGYNPWVGESIKPGVLALVHENGPARVVADDVGTPNGLAISSDGARLIVAETHRDQLVSFQIGTDGSLDDRRVFATLPGGPDGICLDEEGASWVAIPALQEVIRVRPGGQVTHKLEVGANVAACMLGGEDGDTLYVCCGDPDFTKLTAAGRILSTQVPVPHAGLP